MMNRALEYAVAAGLFSTVSVAASAAQLDIAGVSLGMSEADAKAKISEGHKVVEQPVAHSMNNVEGAEIIIAASLGDDWGLMLLNGKVVHIEHHLQYQEGKGPVRQQVIDALKTKFGQPFSAYDYSRLQGILTYDASGKPATTMAMCPNYASFSGPRYDMMDGAGNKSGTKPFSFPTGQDANNVRLIAQCAIAFRADLTANSTAGLVGSIDESLTDVRAINENVSAQRARAAQEHQNQINAAGSVKSPL